MGGYPRAAGALSSPAPLPATGCRSLARALTHDPTAPLVSIASSRGTGRGGKGGGAAGAGGGGPGQRLVVSGLQVSGASVRASVAPAASPTGGGACPPVVRTAGGWGRRSGSGGPGLSGGGFPVPLVCSQPPVSVAWG